MSKIGEREFDMQCRLCTSTEEGHIQIFGPEGESQNLASKIKECLPVSVSTHAMSICFPILFSCKIGLQMYIFLSKSRVCLMARISLLWA
jgi:hypothetical protein